MNISARIGADDADRVPLVVDVEGALVKTSLLQEKIMQFLARTPLEAWRLLPWIVQGRLSLRRNLDVQVSLQGNTIPLRSETMASIRKAQSQGREIYLASTADRVLVQQLADAIGGISGSILMPPDLRNGDSWNDRLNTAFGICGYDYIGGRPQNLVACRSARQVFAVSPGGNFSRTLLREFPNAEIIAESRHSLAPYIRALRPHQWSKNLLVLLSLVAGHHFDAPSVFNTLIALVCFCLAASSAYLLNDLLDLPGDRAHPGKRHRPLAAGDIPIANGVAMSAVLMLSALGLSLMLPGRFTLILLGYVALTLAYSLVLKRKLLVDVIVLGGLYTIRVLAGIAAVASAYSYWLLMFCLFLFLSLATVKRCAELVANAAAGKSPPTGRGYRHGDTAVLFPLAAASGYGAVLVVALYLSSPEVAALYSHPLRLWLLCPLLLYWISRILVLASRNELHHDPVTFALTDRISLLTGVAAGAIIAAAI
jgi:4-hydroxybenzoate polyprenyltransferase